MNSGHFFIILHSLGACVSSCSGITPGNYQSCVTCLGYVSCAAGEILYNMPCPTGTEWDDSTKLCVYETGVCTLGEWLE